MATTLRMSKTYTKMRIGEQKSDFAYWQTQSYQERLATLEQIRQEYHAWRYGTQPRLQRVYRIIKRQ
jgi:serine/threonine protein kinase HipA of HipAB toxin-antitoxin module